MNYADENNLDVTNPTPRCPVILLLDTSGSMEGDPIDELHLGLEQFIKETSEDETASMSVEVEVITYGGGNVEVAVPFSPIYDVKVPELTACGNTPLGEALELANSELAQRRRLYRQSGTSSYKPWIILMTDGMPNDEWEEPAEQMKKLGEQNKLTYIGIGIGDNADFETLRQILPAQPGPVKLKDLCFREFFRWLTDSLKSVSASSVAEQDNVRLGNITSWADLAGTPNSGA